MHQCWVFIPLFIDCGYLGARFGFVLDEDLKEAAACDDVTTALDDKITRERIGTEVCW